MSIFWYRLKYFTQSIAVIGVSALLVCFLYASNVSRFSILHQTDFADGIMLSSAKSVYYLHSPSSQGARTESLTLRDLPFIQGESMALEITQTAGNGVATGACEAGIRETDVKKIAELLAKEFGAKILFTEEVCGVQSYYCYTPRWLNGVILNGKKINLHIALRVCEDRLVQDGEYLLAQGVIGSPIIFDGY